MTVGDLHTGEGLTKDQRIVLADIEYHTDPSPLTTEEKVEYMALRDRFLEIPYCPWTPNPGPQENFLLDFGRDAMYGGAVGGAKSIAGMMGASQFLNVPGYEALLIRKHYTDLVRPGALMDVASEWWQGQPGVKFNSQDHSYRFDAHDHRGQFIGYSRITFGAMDNVTARFKYQGGRWSYVFFDELTQFSESDFTYMFSRMRRVKSGPTSVVPMRMRSATNPGGSGHQWVYKRYITAWERWIKGLGPRPRRNFHPALLDDNPHLDKIDYIESLMELDPITRSQLLKGDWNIRPDGRMFKREWFKPVRRDEIPPNCQWVRFWDIAATDAVTGWDPDYTVGLLMGKSSDGRFYIADVRRWRKDPAESERLMRLTAEHDTRRVSEIMEQEPGASGKVAIHHYRTGPFITTGLRGVSASGGQKRKPVNVTAGRHTPQPKVNAAGPLSSHADAGLIHVVVDGSWEVDDFLAEIEIFPDGEHDDQVDAASGAINALAKMASYGLSGLGEVARELHVENQWRPDAVKNFGSSNDGSTTWDTMHGQRITGVREAQERLRSEKEIMQSIEDAFTI
jgi:predicted phage terminase large subunit-like protein